MSRIRQTFCPCGSAAPLAACCGPYLAGAAAPTPEALMRSRYTAYVLGDASHLARTWHPATVPDLSGVRATGWVALAIVASAVAADGAHGSVEFVAKLLAGDRLETLHEVSAFERLAGRWVYVSGELRPAGAAVRVAMKADCPCGSGKKFKNCHA